MSSPSSSIEKIQDDKTGLHVTIYRGCQDNEQAEYWWDVITKNTKWYRVKYKSGRFQKDCETPCWTTFFGGHPRYEPYVPVPNWLQPLVNEISDTVQAKFNAILVRLYFDGDDEIAWHTDGRTFLGPKPTIASLSFGDTATFQMRRMNNVWPEPGSGDDGIDHTTPGNRRNFIVKDGDLLVMSGPTQKYWHHRVPKQKGRRPRLNINFRYIIPGTPDAERGQKTYYRYMVHGDNPKPESFTFQQIMAQRGGIMNFLSNKKDFPSNITTTIAKQETIQKSGTGKLKREGQEQYLASEDSIDADIFHELPENIQKELIIEWKRKKLRSSSSRSKKTKSSTDKKDQGEGISKKKRSAAAAASTDTTRITSTSSSTSTKGIVLERQRQGGGPTIESFFTKQKTYRGE